MTTQHISVLHKPVCLVHLIWCSHTWQEKNVCWCLHLANIIVAKWKLTIISDALLTKVFPNLPSHIWSLWISHCYSIVCKLILVHPLLPFFICFGNSSRVRNLFLTFPVEANLCSQTLMLDEKAWLIKHKLCCIIKFSYILLSYISVCFKGLLMCPAPCPAPLAWILCSAEGTSFHMLPQWVYTAACNSKCFSMPSLW